MRFTENQVFRISPETFNEIDDYIRACDQSGRNVTFGINALVMLMARTNQAFAMEMSAGPLDPRMQNRAAAWKIPVRRITSRYYKGWKVQRLAPGVWMLFNDSREAYFIEFGIHPSGFKVEGRGGRYYMKGSPRVRRPVRKLSLKRTLRFVDQSNVEGMVWEMIYAPFRPGRHFTNRGDALTMDAVQSVEGMRFL